MREIRIKSASFKKVFPELVQQYNGVLERDKIIINTNDEEIIAKGYQINSNLEVTSFEGRLNEPLRLIREKQEKDTFVIVYFLTPFKLTDDIEEASFRIREKKYWSNLKRDEVFFFDAKAKVSFLTIKYDRAFIEKYNINNKPFISQMLNGKDPFIIYENISSATLKLIQEVKDCDFDNEIELLKLDYLTFRLLYNFANKVAYRFKIQALPRSLPEVDVEKIFMVKEYIEKNFEEKISAEDLAEVAQFSYSKLRKLFKEIIGDSILQYTNDYKLQRAHQWLEAGSHNVSDCTYSLGFTSVTHFGKLFKEKYGCLPSTLSKF
ncbi:AraC family transcriptional regulator [Flammeovirga pectinis]|uniref:AraC family transcriptional regulator n=1 Tax=Flammeovirga pectinis TaxID=2494373 RepID=A0A3Q9FP80_9BACT|nr:AraC family transcriptional regulator [Flammeovirga pectinis]AZQ61649.1 AraC family transcriptional regulator [Flammeovirga pectinis]